LADRLRRSGRHHPGNTGEFLTVTDEERRRYVETTVKHVAGRMLVMVGR